MMRGIVTVLNTPFTADDRLDTAGLDRNTREALDAGVAGFLVNAKAAEAHKLSAAERAEVAARVCAVVAGAVPVVVSVSAAGAPERLRLAQDALRAGADGLLYAPEHPAPDAVRAAMHALAELAPGFLMLQDWATQGDGLPLDLILALLDEVPAYRCLKVEVPMAGPKYTAVLEAARGRLHVSGGWAVQQMIEGLDRGVHAFMPTGLHHTYCAIYRHYARGERDAARALFDELLPVLAFSNQELEHSIQFFKRLLYAQQIYATPHVRRPTCAFDPLQERHAIELIARALLLEERARRRARHETATRTEATP